MKIREGKNKENKGKNIILRMRKRVVRMRKKNGSKRVQEKAIDISSERKRIARKIRETVLRKEKCNQER